MLGILGINNNIIIIMYFYSASIQLPAQERFLNNFAKSKSDLNKSGVPSSMRNMS